ncbi:MAG: glycosyltransferase [Pseudomonadota bacterium]
MTRILYIMPSPAAATGGNKVSFRHVEALVAMGYDARVRMWPGQARPWWFSSTAPVEESDRRPDPDEILVFPEDDPDVLAQHAALPNRKVVFCQNPYYAVKGLPALPREAQAAYRTFMACSPGVAAWIARFLDYEVIATVPGFADERLFKPADKTAVIACMPRKRPLEQRVIRHMFERQYAGGVDWRWEVIERRTEAEAARALGTASVFLSLARHEGMSMTIAEAMACECLVAGFTGLGPREYTSPLNGFWAEEDDCEAAAEALLRAVRLAEAGGGPAALMRHAARTAAAGWTHAGFVQALATFWRDEMGVTP